MKRLLVLMLLMLLTPPLLAAQQVSRYDNIAIGNLAGGNLLQALPNATIQVTACSSMSASCTLPANLCSSIVDTNCGLPGVLTADSGGNFHFYARAGRYQVVIVAAGFQTRTIPDVILPLSVSDGAGVGTQVIVNGTAAVPNSLNFNSVAPQPPANSTIIRWNLNGNNVLGYFSGSGNATDCLLGTGVFGPCPGGGGGGGSLTVNGGTGGSDLNDILPTFPPNGINISWQAANGHISGAIVGDGIGTHCFLGTGVFAQCPGSGAAGVSSINGLTGALTFTGSVSCSGATCNFPGGTGGGLPPIPQYNLFASNGTGGAQDSTIKAGPPGFLQAEVVTATGDITSAAAPFQLFPNAGVEYFPSGYTWSGGTSGATNGLAMYMSHSAGSAASGNGGVALGGGNSSGTGNQVYLDCEASPTAGCDFKVPITVNGAGVGGGGGGLPTIPQYNLYASNGAGGAQDSGTKAGLPGFLETEVLLATGDVTSQAAPFQLFPNASVEYFPTGYTWSGGTAGAAHGFAGYFSHSAGTTAAANGGIGLGGGNSGGVGNQIYLDCETTGCDFKVQPTFNGNPIGGGGGGSGTVSSGTAGHFTWYAATGTTVAANPNLDDDLTTPSTITSQEPIAAPQINVNGAVGTGIAMTGAGGNLPTPALGQGGIGIGPGNVPMYSSNGGAWTAIGAGGATLPACSATPANSCVVASNAAGTAAVDTGVKASGGFIQSGASIVNGTAASSPFTGANASQEFYAAGGTITPSTGSPITFTNGAALFMGHGASTAGATGDGGIALGGGSATPTQRIYLDCEVAGCDFKVPVTSSGNPLGGGSGTVLPSAGGSTGNAVNGALLAYSGTWVASRVYLLNQLLIDSNNNVQRVTAAGTAGTTVPPWSTTVGQTTPDGTATLTLQSIGGGNTTVAPIATVTANTTGLNMGVNVVQFSPTGASPDVGLVRYGTSVLGVSTGTQGNINGYFKSGGNYCATTSDQTTNGAVLCSKTLPANANALPWVVRCVIPWTVVGASGSATVSTRMSFTQAPANVTTFSARMVGTTLSSFGTFDLPLTNFSNQTVATISVNSGDTSTYITYLDGVISTTASGGAFSVSVASNSGSATARAGLSCTFN